MALDSEPAACAASRNDELRDCMAPPLLQLKEIALTFGGTPLLTGAELSVSAGERVSLVGRNGSGKSTLLKIAAGLVEPDRGSVFVQPGALVRYLPQEPDFSGFASTLGYVEAGLPPAEDAHAARSLLDELGLSGEEDPAHLSGGEARRAALARVLAPTPDILLLDEPTNHLDLPTIEWLERELDSRRAALVIISHDRRFLSNLSRADGLARPRRDPAHRARLRRFRGMARRGAGRGGARAAQARAQDRRGRALDALRRHRPAQAQCAAAGRAAGAARAAAQLSRHRRQRRHHGRRGGAVRQAGDRGRAHWPRAIGGRPIVSDFSIRIQRGDRIGIVGPNGSGKTTLIGTADRRARRPTRGTVKLGANLALATLDQHRDSLDPNVTVADALTGGSGDTVMVNGKPKHVVGYMKDFLFSPEQARTPLGKLSGGERGRLMLAQALAKPSNLLVLDEPTNDLDMETLDVLEDMLADYPGTVLLVSHDRDFLDRLVSGVIVPEGDGRWTEYAGGYSDMLAQRGADLDARRRAKPEPRKAAKAERRPRHRRRASDA